MGSESFDFRTLHSEYLALGLSKERRLSAYRDLFRAHLSESEMMEIRESANKGWVLGSDRFKDMVEEQMSRLVQFFFVQERESFA